ncbi:MAG: hypothetical protein KF768_00065 [Phycisphaeraceae bacterium]|nr:hypothetical protein [Phycisphaeraceae bacterium]
MQAGLTKRVEELVELGWQPLTTTETTASLVGRRPFSWWLFVLLLLFFPGFGGLLYLIFWLATSRATVFLHQDAEGEEVKAAGDLWLVSMQEARREHFITQQRAIKQRGFLAVMWPHLLVFVVLVALWIVALRSIL